MSSENPIPNPNLRFVPINPLELRNLAPEGTTYLWSAPEHLETRLKNGWSFVPAVRHKELIEYYDPRSDHIVWQALTLIERQTDAVKEQQALDRDKSYDHPHMPGIVRAPIPVTVMIHVPRTIFDACRDSGVSTEQWAQRKLKRAMREHDTGYGLVPHRTESSFQFVNLRIPRRGWGWLYRMITKCDSSSSA